MAQHYGSVRAVLMVVTVVVMGFNDFMSTPTLIVPS